MPHASKFLYPWGLHIPGFVAPLAYKTKRLVCGMPLRCGLGPLAFFFFFEGKSEKQIFPVCAYVFIEMFGFA